LPKRPLTLSWAIPLFPNSPEVFIKSHNNTTPESTKTLVAWIDGQKVSGATNGTSKAVPPAFPNLNPATGEVLSYIEESSQELVDQAVSAAARAQKAWAQLTGVQRGRILHKASELLRQHKEELAVIEVRDSGKPLVEAMGVDIDSAADCLEYYAGVASSMHAESYQLGTNFAYTRREPLGVCGAIGAWNYPLQIACWKAAPALCCGNAVVYKPSELTSTSALRLAEIFIEAGLPAGLFNVVLGGGSVGQMLTAHPGIAKISFTGEIGTGKKVMASSACNLKSLSLELGGKSPIIIFEDAEIEDAVNGVLWGNFFTQGEICSNGTRVFVAASIKQKFLQRLIERTKMIRLGDPMNLDTQMGSLISSGHKEKVMALIASGIAEGAVLACGGEAPKGTVFERGHYVLPTIFDRCTDNMRIVKEEIFGPVLSLLTFESEEEVIERANSVSSGLAAGVFTRDIQRAHRVIHALEAGTCWINTYNMTPIEVPFGGYKESGLGRENSLHAINAYTQVKSIYVELGKVPSPF
jgi:betaine-aldehyde dehydrogenase